MEDNKAFLNAFEALAGNEDIRGGFTLTGDCILVEDLSEQLTENKTASGLIVSAPSSQTRGNLAELRPVFARVLMVGEGYYNDDNEAVPLDVEAGDIILVGKNSIGHFSQFGKLNTYGKIQMGLTRESEILMRFRGQDAFNDFFSFINKEVSKEEGAA